MSTPRNAVRLLRRTVPMTRTEQHRDGDAQSGYPRFSADDQDLTARRDALVSLGVAPERMYVDHGLTGTNRVHSPQTRVGATVPGRGPLPCRLDVMRSAPEAGDDEIATVCA